jgi:hypothetical protein
MKSCHTVFEHCLARSCLARNDWAQNRHADFNLWDARSGAMSGKTDFLSLRLRSRPRLLALVRNILVILNTSLEDCLTADEGPRVDEAIRTVDSALENLGLVATAINQSRRSPAFQKADRVFDPRQHSELMMHLAFLVLVRGTSEGRSQELDLYQLSSIQMRLIDANLRRRNRFLYAQRRTEKPRDVQTRTQLEPPNLQKPGLPQELVSPRAEASIVNLKPSDTESIANAPAVSGTSASVLGGNPLRQLPSIRSRPWNRTKGVSITGAERYPTLPKPSHKDANTVKCPCCCQILPVSMLDDIRWRYEIIPFRNRGVLYLLS